MRTAEDFVAAAPWLTQPPLSELLAILDGDGEEARVIGGAVRNALFGEPPGDIDIATTALPQEVSRRAEKAGFRTVPTGIEHGTVTIVAHGRPFEVTTLREDIETFGRKAVVRFGRNWQADAERRDFTINALAATRDGRVIDLVGGLADIEARRVRFIGEPAQRIREDFLRILRFFRFHARYGDGAPDAGGLAAAIMLRAGLELLSRERVHAEIAKLLVAPGAAPVLRVMVDAGLLTPILGVPLIAQFARLAAVEEAFALPPDAVRRLGALAVHVTDDADRLRVRLRLSNRENERLAAMADGWRSVAPGDEKPARALLYRLGSERYLDHALFAWSRSGAAPDDPAWRVFATLPERWSAPEFPLAAADFIARGVAAGPALGAALARAEEAWIATDFPTDAAIVTALADACAAFNRD